MITKLGQDGHDRGAKVVPTSYTYLGFDVETAPLFQTPEEAAKQAIKKGVDVLGISSLAASHKTLVPQVISEIKQQNSKDILVIVGSVIPPKRLSIFIRCRYRYCLWTRYQNIQICN